MRSFRMAGKYNGDESSLPQREHPEGYVPFDEPEDMKILAKKLSEISIILLAVIMVIFFLRGGFEALSPVGTLLSLVCLVPHEFLHGVCMKGDVLMYNNLKQGMLFVISTEDVSKARFIFMSMCPNLVFGIIPFILFLINPSLTVLGTLGMFSIPMGVGDYLNVYNAATQMPKGALTYLSGMHSYWYMPEK